MIMMKQHKIVVGGKRYGGKGVFQCVLFLAVCLVSTQAFFGNMMNSNSKSKKTSLSPYTEEALSLFDKSFPFGREPLKDNPLVNFGMPYTDIDGSPVRRRRNDEDNSSSTSGGSKRLTDITEEQAKTVFNELARLYGDDRAIGMVRVQPICLCFDSKKFGPCLDAWTEVFGLEESQDMVLRNPGLLAVKPEDAAKSTDSTMVFSYVVGYTRPLGPFLLAGLLFLVLTPAIEGITGIQYGINH